ncbi:MAG: hypothetical protein BWZ02_00133 [Lentisphaerae bacterium ADurb.BinA184]|nr:MAG: hypothetical protein BWZ02_00133 [Lentisphaerae bacterium ADurb.BinA184]
MRNLARFLLRLVATVGLLGLTWAVIEGLAGLPVRLDPRRVALPFAGGFVLGAALCLSVSRMMAVYVFGHELTHWMAAKCFFRATPKCEIGAEGGSVAVERPNIWITLAPYFVPVYTLILIGLYGVMSFFWRDHPAWVRTVAVGLGGLTYALHVAPTLYALSRAQTDLAAYGYVLSIALILFCNIAIVFVALLAATGEWRTGVVGVGAGVRREVEVAGQAGRWVWATVRLWIERARP